jgi:hypothetical protein
LIPFPHPLQIRRKIVSHSTTLDPATLDILERTRPAFPGEPGPSPEDLEWADREFNRKFGDQPRPIRDARDLLISIGDHLASLGLEPDVKAGAIDVLFLGHLHRVTLIDLDHDVEEMLRGQGDRDIQAAGLPVG